MPVGNQESERESDHGAKAVVASVSPAYDSVPETLLVSSSNPAWPAKVRIISQNSGEMTRVLVADTLGRPLASADTVVATAPVRLLLPTGSFQVRVESFTSDMFVTIPPHQVSGARDAKRFKGSTFGRIFIASRAAEGATVQFSAPAPSMIKGEVVP
jgi:hypothetical protein